MLEGIFVVEVALAVVCVRLDVLCTSSLSLPLLMSLRDVVKNAEPAAGEVETCLSD